MGLPEVAWPPGGRPRHDQSAFKNRGVEADSKQGVSAPTDLHSEATVTSAGIRRSRRTRRVGRCFERHRDGMRRPHAMTKRSGIAILLVVALCGVALVTACGSGAGQKPSTGASETTSPPAPDYAQASNWLSQPSSSDATKPVDVFYLYPTAYMPSSPSAPLVCSADNPQMRAGAKAAFSRTATAFSPFANVYAPYYRQVTIQIVVMPYAKQDQLVGGEPTTDALSAFDYFIKHLNHGRPFILAGHSQGSEIMNNLMADYMKKNPEVYKRMIVAYLPGYSITPQYLQQNSELKLSLIHISE